MALLGDVPHFQTHSSEHDCVSNYMYPHLHDLYCKAARLGLDVSGSSAEGIATSTFYEDLWFGVMCVWKWGIPPKS